MTRTARTLLFVVLLLVVAALAALQAAGTATVASAYPPGTTAALRYTVTWTSDASGNVNTNKFSVTAGRLLAAKFVPNSGGTQPTDLYDATLKDDDGIDLLNGGAADLSNATGKLFQFDPVLFFDSSQKLDLQISNAGNAKGGTVYLWVQP